MTLTLFSTLRARFAVWTALLLVAGFTLFGVYVYLSQRTSLYAGVDDVLRLSASQATRLVNSEDGRLRGPDELRDNSATNESRRRGVTLRLFNIDGTLIQSSGPLTPSLLETDIVSSIQPSFYTAQVNDDPVRVYLVPIMQDSQAIGYMQAAQSLSGVEQTLRRLIYALFLGGPLLIIMAAAGGYYLIARALKPIDRITRTAQAISAADLSQRLNLPSTNDEVGRLAATFDVMLARLDDSFKRERRFAADASHEMRTPLTAMRAILDVTSESASSVWDYQHALNDLSFETDRLGRLVESLLILSQGDEKKPIRADAVNLSNLTSDLCESLQPIAMAKGLELVHVCMPSIIVCGDMDALLRMLMNLIDNAVKYTYEGGVIVRVDYNGLIAFIEISDTGTGIAPQHLPHVFNRFYRADPSRHEPGSGLGLCIARDIARAHGGEITISSIQMQGTTVSISLPMLRNLCGQQHKRELLAGVHVSFTQGKPPPIGWQVIQSLE